MKTIYENKIENILNKYRNIDNNDEKFITFFSLIYKNYSNIIKNSEIDKFVPNNFQEEKLLDVLPLFLATKRSYENLKFTGKGEGKKKLSKMIERSYYDNIDECIKTLTLNSYDQYNEYENFEEYVNDLYITSIIELKKQENSKIYSIVNKTKDFENNKQEKNELNYEANLIRDFFDPEIYITKPKKNLDDIIGNEKQKETIKKYFRSITHPKIYEKYNLNEKMKYRFLFTGLPGTGKNLFSEAIAGEYGFDFMNMPSSMIYNQYLGNSQKIIKFLFSYLAKRKNKTILFLDEIDSFGKKDNDDISGTRVLNTILNILSGREEYNKVFVCGATSKKENIGKDLKRRFNIINLTLPNENERIELFKYYIKNFNNNNNNNVDFNLISKLSKNFTPSDIETVITDVFINISYKESILKRNPNKELNTEEIISAIRSYSINNK